MITTNQKYYDFHNGINFITFGLIELDVDNEKVIVGISDLGKIIVTDYPLFEDKNGNLYFEYGVDYEKIYIEDFEWEVIIMISIKNLRNEKQG